MRLSITIVNGRVRVTAHKDRDGTRYDFEGLKGDLAADYASRVGQVPDEEDRIIRSLYDRFADVHTKRGDLPVPPRNGPKER
jgi:hypothetical protein